MALEITKDLAQAFCSYMKNNFTQANIYYSDGSITYVSPRSIVGVDEINKYAFVKFELKFYISTSQKTITKIEYQSGSIIMLVKDELNIVVGSGDVTILHEIDIPYQI